MNKPKLVLKALLLCFVVFLASCEKEPDFSEPEKTGKGNIQATPFAVPDESSSRINFNPALLLKINEVKAKILLAQTLPFSNSQYKFSFDDQKGLEVKVPNYDSYTFLIKRSYPQTIVENLVFSKNTQGGYDVIIATYDMTMQQLSNVTKDQLRNKVRYTNLSTGKLTALCTFVVIMCSDHTDEPYDHVATVGKKCFNNGVENLYVSSVTQDCPGGGDSGGDGGGGGGSGSGGSGGSGSGGGGGGGTETEGEIEIDPVLSGQIDIITVPITEQEIDPEKEARHIASLNEITNDRSRPYSPKVKVLRESLAQNKEKGFEFRTNENGSLQPAREPVSTVEDGVDFGIPEENALVRMHNHTNSLDPIFSEEDIYKTTEFFVIKDDLEAEDSEDITSLLISRKGGYALKIGDPDKVYQFYLQLKKTVKVNGQYKTGYEAMVSAYNLEVILTANKKCNGTCTNAEYDAYLEEFFAPWFNSLDSGFYYYKGTLQPHGIYTWAIVN